MTDPMRSPVVLFLAALCLTGFGYFVGSRQVDAALGQLATCEATLADANAKVGAMWEHECETECSDDLGAMTYEAARLMVALDEAQAALAACQEASSLYSARSQMFDTIFRASTPVCNSGIKAMAACLADIRGLVVR